MDDWLRSLAFRIVGAYRNNGDPTPVRALAIAYRIVGDMT